MEHTDDIVDIIYIQRVSGKCLSRHKLECLFHAKLRINSVPGLAECEDCDEIFNVIEHKGYCPNCGSFEKTILSGKDFTIREIVVPET